MSDFTHARICISHASGSVEIQAPAGEVTWLDLSGLHALPVIAGNGVRPKRRVMTTLALLGCSAAIGAGVEFMSSNHPSSTVSLADAAAALAVPQQPIPLDMPVPSIGQAPRAVPAPLLGGQPAAHDADPFGLRLK